MRLGRKFKVSSVRCAHGVERLALNSTGAAIARRRGECWVEAGGQGGSEVSIEDLAWIVVDTPQATLTSALISACMEAGVAMVVTDSRHTPSGLVLPFHRHHRQGGVARLQTEAKESLKRRMWQIIVRRKICNQSAALAAVGKDDAATLKEIARHVESGDPENVEARAARFYCGDGCSPASPATTPPIGATRCLIMATPLCARASHVRWSQRG